MRVNENIAISTPKVLLVPYDAHHVGRYHAWMQDDELREATASDLLSLEEEYENQISWRTAVDKLTFIVCLPLLTPTIPGEVGIDGGKGKVSTTCYAGVDDADMVGDVNLFLTPCHEADDGNECCDGEIDIMIARPEHRRRGLGEAVVVAFLRFLKGRFQEILGEYSSSSSSACDKKGTRKRKSLKRLVAKINADNIGSIRLFENLGFVRDGEPNYFNEVSLVLGFGDLVGKLDGDGNGYAEVVYDRSRLK